MEKSLRRAIIMLSKYFAIGFLVQLAIFSTLMGKSVEAQLNSPIRASLQNVSVKQVFDILKKSANVTFVYDARDINGSLQIDISDTGLSASEVLYRLASRLDVDYKKIGNTITLKKKAVATKADNLPYLPMTPMSSINNTNIKVVRLTQVFTVSGTVTDSVGNPLIGVSVQIKGTTRGTVTEANGYYEIEAPENATLVFSYVGYQNREISVNRRGKIDVQLSNSVSELSQLVVVGYGTQEKKDQTTASASIEAKQLVSPSTGNVGNMLEGLTPGLSVKNNEGTPGNSPIIRIRGASSLQGSNEALIVIDGLQGGDLTSLNPNDIQSIQVLKGPSATAIYGSEGSNGVILVTTKKGTSRTPEINYTSTYTISNVNDRAYKLMNAATFARNANLIALADNLNQNPTPIYSDAQIADFEKNGGTDWLSKIFRTGSGFNNSLNISGRGDRINYFFSGSFLNQNGTSLKSNYKRYTARVNLDFTLTEWLDFNINWAGSISDQHNNLRGASGDKLLNPLFNAIIYPPTVPVYDSTGNYRQVSNDRGSPFWSYNPVATAIEPINKTKINNNNVFASFEIKPFKNQNLSLKIQGGARKREYNYLQYLNEHTFDGASANGQSTINYLSTTFLQNTDILSYTKEFGRHTISVNGIYEQKSNVEDSRTLSNKNFPTQQTNVFDLGSALTQRTSSSYNSTHIASWVARIHYNYADKYLVTASYRADASSVFGANNKWGSFPSASVAWRASQEEFLRDSRLISNLKLRLGWGIVGNQAISPYQSLSAIGSSGTYPLYDDADIPAYAILRPPNPNLKWEETEQENIGLDISFLNEALNFQGDYFLKDTKNLLMPSENPQYTGIAQIVRNMGELSGRGFEASVNYRFNVGKFTINTNFNVSHYYIKVEDLGNNQQVEYKGGTGGYGANEETVYMFKGERFGQFYLWVDEGTWSTTESKEALRYGQLPGDTKYKDVNNDGIIDQDDRVKVGHINPNFEYGFNTQIDYNKFSFSFNINAVTGNKILNQTRTNALLESNYTDRWTTENQNTDVPAIIDNKTRAEETAGYPSTINIPYTMFGATTRFLDDGSYVRLRTVQLSYNLAGGIIKNRDIKNLSVYIVGENLITLTNYTGFNPEVSAFQEATRQGYSVVNYPVAQSITFGLNLTF